MISGDKRGKVLLWEIATGRIIASVKAHEDVSISCLAVTPDGSSFVSGSWDRTLKLWRFGAVLQPVIQFIGHTHCVNACAVSSDGSQLYSVSDDRSIRVWNMITGQQLIIIQSAHDDCVSSLALSGSLLVSGSFDKTVKLWDTGSMQLLHTLRGHSEYITSVAVSSDSSGSQRVLSGGFSIIGEHKMRQWDAASGAQLSELHGHPVTQSSVTCITVSSDSCFAASASNRTICVWDLASRSVCATLEGHKSPVKSVLFV